MKFIKNFHNYTSIKTITAEVKSEDKGIREFIGESLEDLIVECRVVQFDENNLTFHEDMLDFLLEDGLKLNNETWLIYAQLMQMFWNNYLLAVGVCKTEVIDYRNSFRRFDVRSLSDLKNESFSQNWLLNSESSSEGKLKKILNSVRFQSGETFRQIFVDTLFVDNKSWKSEKDNENELFNFEILFKFSQFQLHHAEKKTTDAEMAKDFVNEFCHNSKSEDEKAAFRRLIRRCEEIDYRIREAFYCNILAIVFVENNFTLVEINANFTLYSRIDLLLGYIVTVDPLFIDFWNSLKKSIQDLLLCVLFSKQYSQEKRNRIMYLILHEFVRYLKFYPVWLEIVRINDRGNKRQKSNQKYETNFSDVVEARSNRFTLGVDGFLDEDVLLGDVLKSETNIYRYINLVELEEFIENKLSIKQKEVVKKVMIFGFTEGEVAEELHISQSAVSQRLKSAKILLSKFLRN